MFYIPAGRIEHNFKMRTSPCVPRQYRQTLRELHIPKTIVSKAVATTALTSPSEAVSDVDSLGDDTTSNFPQIGSMPGTNQPATAAYQLPPDVAVALNRLITRASSQTTKATRFCLNCCVPLTGPQCTVCDHHVSADAAVVAPAVISVWKQHLQTPDKQLTQQRRRRNRHIHRTALAFDERMLPHMTSLPPYPERPERLKAVLTRLETAGLIAKCVLMPARKATDVELLRVHSRELVQGIQAASIAALTPLPPHIPSKQSDASHNTVDSQACSSHPSAGEGFHIAADTLCSQHTYQAASLAAGSAAAMAIALMNGTIDNGMAVIRPPGHHATRTTAQNGCFFNNAAVAARAAQAAGASRVMILDWGIHHGHGTESIFEEDNNVLVVSMHRADEEFYPWTGQVTDVGVGDGAGFTLNIPWSDNTITAADYMQAALHVVLPVCYEFQPDLVIVSAGFDGVAGDPLGGCALPPEVYAHLTHLVKGVAPTMLLMEGGYNLEATARCAEACVRVLLGERPRPLPGSWDLTQAGTAAVMSAVQVHSQFWPCLHPLSLDGWMTAIQEQQQQPEGGHDGDLEEGEEGQDGEREEDTEEGGP